MHEHMAKKIAAKKILHSFNAGILCHIDVLMVGLPFTQSFPNIFFVKRQRQTRTHEAKKTDGLLGQEREKMSQEDAKKLAG
jgi:hypothetical protein